MPPYDVSDLTSMEASLFSAWCDEASRLETPVSRALGIEEARVKSRAPMAMQRALNALAYSSFVAAVAERMVIGDLKQVIAYMTEAALRSRIQARIAAEVTDQTTVLIGHSLGSAIAYEALCAHPNWSVRTFISIGSPLGIPKLIFDRLIPSPVKGMGVWPGSACHWVNIADVGDLVALVKDLRPQFGAAVVNLLVHNGARAHNARPYLTAKETGEAVAHGLFAIAASVQRRR